MSDLEHWVGVRLNKEDFDHLSEVAGMMECNVSQAIRIIIREAKVITRTRQVPITTSSIEMRTIVKTVNA
jgi:hypothetical protein